MSDTKQAAIDNGFRATHPSDEGNARERYPCHFGLTKREHFAALAMQGLMACRNMTPIEQVAVQAVDAADALLLALEEVKP